MIELVLALAIANPTAAPPAEQWRPVLRAACKVNAYGDDTALRALNEYLAAFGMTATCWKRTGT